MAQPVWVLSVDLQTKTATFQTGLADAAKAARGSFQDIQGGASGMGGRVSYSMSEARHSVMLLGEEFGVHLPRALTTFIAGLGPIGPALEAAFPFMAIAVGATLLIEKLVKMHEAGEKLTTDQLNFGTAANNALSSLDEKLLQVQIKADDLSGNHMAALKHQLELIDHQSLNELQHSFLELARSMEPVMKDLEGHWYTFGEGSDGAKHALDDFRTHYEYLLSQGKKEEASGLLHGTLGQAKKTLEMMDQLKASQSTDGKNGNYQAYEQAAAYLEKMGVFSKATGDYTKKTYDAQLNLVSALTDQVTAEQRIADIKKLEQQNATTSTHKEMGKEAESAARKKAEEQTRLDREYLQNFRHSQQDLINATREGTADRLDALQAAMDATAGLYGRDNETYRQYASEYIRTWNDMSAKTLEAIGKEMDEESRLNDQAIKQQIAAREVAAKEKTRHSGAMEKIQKPQGNDFAEKKAELDREYNANHDEKVRELADAAKMGKDRVATERRIQDEIAALDRKHVDQTQEIAAEEVAAHRQASAGIANNYAQGFLRVAEGQESMRRMSQQVAESIISNSLKAAIATSLHAKDEQLAQAKVWASGAGSAVSKIPYVGPILAPIAAAAGFAAAMAFEGGTDRVPGIDRGDVVPAMLTPGEGVVPGGVMDGLRNIARNGGFEHAPQYHVTTHVHMNASALDSDGMETVLNKHADRLQRHFENTLRRMNR
jgi:hypothetical protein